MAFAYMTLHAFYQGHKPLMELILNDMERETAAAYFARGQEPHDFKARLLAIADKFKKPEKAAMSSYLSAKEKVEQRYRLRQDLNLFEEDLDSIGYLPISRTEVIRKLFKLGYQRLEQLRTATDATLLAIDGFGPVIVKEIREAIEVHDREIAPRPEPPAVTKPRKPRLTKSILTGSRRMKKAEKAGQMALAVEG